jgi:hypothetical protein
MTTSLPVRKLYLDDLITKHHKGFSPMRNNQQLAWNYTYLNNIYNLSLFSSLTMAYMSYTKIHTKRMTYLKGFVVVSAITSALWYARTQYHAKVLTEFGCEENKFKEYLEFYYNALLDFPNYYESDHKIHK